MIMNREMAIDIQATKILYPNITYVKLAKKYEVTATTISKAANAYYNDRFNISDNDIESKIKELRGGEDDKKVEVSTNDATQITVKEPTTQTQKEPNNEFKGFDVDKLTELNIVEPLKCGLVDNRHEGIPTTLFVYSNITETQMFDYTHLYDRAKEFVQDNIGIDENGVPERDMVLYATGLQCALAAVVRACYTYKVNLYIMHFSNRNKKYYKQVVFNEFNDHILRAPNEIKGVLGVTCNKAYTYKTNVNDFVQNNVGGFIITENAYVMPPTSNNNDVFSKKCIIIKEQTDAFACYNALCTHQMYNKMLYTELTIHRIIRKDNGDFTKGNRLHRSTNW